MSNAMRSGAGAIRARQAAQRYRAMKPVRGDSDVLLNQIEVEREDAAAEALLRPVGELAIRCGEVVAPADPADSDPPIWINTLKHPNMVAVEASEQRLEAAARAGVLQSAVDAADSVCAANSLEKMLAHQMAGAHHGAMRLLARAADSQLPPVEAARLTNAAARLMDVYQAGLVTLQRVRTNGRQTVVVQHVEVSGGSQAVIAGSVKSGRRGAKGGG